MDRLPRSGMARNRRAQPDELSLGCDSPAPGRTSTFGFSRRKRRVGLPASQDRFCRVANNSLVLVRVLIARGRLSNRREFAGTPHDTAYPAHIAVATIPWRAPPLGRDTSASSDTSAPHQ